MTIERLKRLEDEQTQLESRINRLESFMISNDFNSLCDLQKSLLIQQYNHMCSYNNVLCLRLRIIDSDLVGLNSERIKNAKQ